MAHVLGNSLSDPSLAGALWSDPLLQSLYDVVHAAALSLAGATSLLHEALVDIVRASKEIRASASEDILVDAGETLIAVGTLTVPNLSEHLTAAETTEELSARFNELAGAVPAISDRKKDANGWRCFYRQSGRNAPGRPP